MTDQPTTEERLRLYADPLAYLIATTLAGQLPGREDLLPIVRTSLLLADRIRLALNLPAPERQDTPFRPPSAAVEALERHRRHSETKPGVTDGYAPDTAQRAAALPDATGSFEDFGISVEDIDPAAIKTALWGRTEPGWPLVGSADHRLGTPELSHEVESYWTDGDTT